MAVVKNIVFLLNGHNIACALTGFTVNAESEELDKTTVCTSGLYREYEQGFKSGNIQTQGIFDSDTVNEDEIHDIYSDAYDSGAAKNLAISTGTIATGGPAILMNGVQMNYEIPIDTGALIFANGNFRSDGGIHFGVWLLHDASGSTVTGSSVDNGASTANGGVFQAHLENSDATDVDIKLQHSTDDSNWADVTGGAINNLTQTHESGSVTVTGTINRYIRAVATITGGSTVLVSAAFARG